MSNQSDAAVKRNMSWLFAGLFGFFLAMVFLARALVY